MSWNLKGRLYTTQTEGKFERSVSHVKKSFWAGIMFSHLDDLNRQAHAWSEGINSGVLAPSTFAH